MLSAALMLGATAFLMFSMSQNAQATAYATPNANELVAESLQAQADQVEQTNPLLAQIL